MKCGLNPREAHSKVRLVRCLKLSLVLAALCGLGLPAEAASAKIIKVLPQYLDLAGKHALTPDLFDRDAYQARLRQHPERRSGLRFAVQWKAKEKKPLKLRIELRGTQNKQPTTAVLEAVVTKHGWFSNWTYLPLTSTEYKKFGDLVAWRATLWDGDTLAGEQKSFLW